MSDKDKDKDEDTGLFDLLCGIDELRLQLIGELKGLRQDLQAVADSIPIIAPRNAPQPAPGQAAGALPLMPGQADQLVTIDQMAAIVHLKKRGFERHVKKLPPPRIKGTGGRVSRWAWPEVRGYLERAFGLKMPEAFPNIGDRRDEGDEGDEP